MFLPRLPSSRAAAKNAARLAPTKDLKTGAHATPHSASQPPSGGDLVLGAEAVKLREAVARGALEAQLAQAQEGRDDACQSGVVVAARADAEEEAGRGGAENAARLDVEVEVGRGDTDSAARPIV